MSVVSHTIRSASLHGYLDLAQSLGLNPSALLAEVGIERSSLDHPDTPIPAASACELLERSALRAGTDTFGLQMAARRRLSNLGLIGVVLREEPTGLAMLESLCRYLKLANHSLSTQVEQAQDLLTIREDILVSPSQKKNQSVELTVGIMHRLLSEVMGSHWRAQLVCFRHSAPKDLLPYRQFFSATLRFNASFNGIVCKTSDFERRLPNTDMDSVKHFRSTLDQALAAYQKTNTEQIKELIEILLPAKRCKLTHIARHLGVSTRTIHRQLALEHTSFNQLLLTVRQKIAAQYLLNPAHSANELSNLLGFSSPSVFAHWFQLQYGTSSRAWRKQRTTQGLS